MAYLHDYIVTDNYVVFPDTSLRASRSRLAEHGSVYYFDKEYKMRWGVIPRFPKSGDAVRWFETERPGYIWHMVNGWERMSEDGKPQIELYAPMFSDYPSDVPIHSPKEPHAKLRKWILDLESRSVTLDKQLLDGAHERPSINLNFSGKPAQFAYLLDESSGYMGKGVLKYDLSQERALEYLDYGDYLGGEALFVPKKDGVTEDDGYLIDLLMKDDSADLVVIDARTMKELARIQLPSRVPFGVHACWLTEDQIAQLRHEKG
jgi:carotenoid cleavage dioxygenase-like enzyme